METGEFATDHDAIVSLARDMKWLREHHEHFCAENATAHEQMYRDNKDDHEKFRQEIKDAVKPIVEQQHEPRISTLEERTRWLKLLWISGIGGGIGGIVGGIYAAVKGLSGG